MPRRSKAGPAPPAGAFVGGPILARALQQFLYRGRTIMANDLVRGKAVIQHLENAGRVDTNPGQVDYCISRGAEPIDLEDPEA